MVKRVLLTGAGGGGSNNLARSLRHRTDIQLVGANADEWALLRSYATPRYVIPHSSDIAAYIAAINDICERESIDLIVPTNDTEALVTSEHRDELAARTALPAKEIISLSRDKLDFHLRCEELGVPVARTRGMSSLDDLPALFDELQSEPEEMVWCRMRVGNASKGALPVSNVAQAEQWIAYWCDMREAKVDEFIVGEYLPGRDWAFQGFWVDGKLVIGKAVERLQYIFAGKTPAGRFSTPSVGKVVHEPEVTEVCVEAINTLAPGDSGIFSIDLKEGRDGRPYITEINAGRFFRINPSMNLSGQYNMAELFMNWALELGDFTVPEACVDTDIGDEPTYYLCNLDEEPVLVGESAFRELVRLDAE